jgi:hypothetical protein
MQHGQPNGSYARRVWFLYEWLIQTQIGLEDAVGGRYAQVLDDRLQYGSTDSNSSRHRIKNNLPGTPDFCPLVFRTPELEAFCAMDLARRAQQIVDEVPRDLLARTAAFLLLKDSRSSYAIEGERPPKIVFNVGAAPLARQADRPLIKTNCSVSNRLSLGMTVS